MRRSPILTAMTACLAIAASPVVAEEVQLGWSGSADLSLVATSGNAKSSTLGFKGLLEYSQADWSLGFEAGAINAEATSIQRTALLLPDGTTRLVEVEETTQTAEAYHLRGRYDRAITQNLSWFTGIGWERNEFAGFANRYAGMGGLARTWFDTEATKLRTDVALTYTREESLADVEESFAGVRLGWDYRRTLTPTTTFTSLMAIDENLEETSDLRVDTTNAIAVAMTDRLALKAGVQLQYDHEPALIAVPVAGTPGRIHFAELDELDTVLTAALVISL